MLYVISSLSQTLPSSLSCTNSWQRKGYHVFVFKKYIYLYTTRIHEERKPARLPCFHWFTRGSVHWRRCFLLHLLVSGWSPTRRLHSSFHRFRSLSALPLPRAHARARTHRHARTQIRGGEQLALLPGARCWCPDALKKKKKRIY